MKTFSRSRLARAIGVVSLSIAAAGSFAKPPFQTPQTELPSAVKDESSRLFQHIGTFDVISGGNETLVAEIIDAAPGGRQLVYTDSETRQIGFVDITDPANPLADGTVDVGGEPTSLVIRGVYVLVAVNTSDGDFVNPTGDLVVVNRNTRNVEAIISLGGQPDSIALAPNNQRAVLILENERDEDLGDGYIPQNRSGEVLIIDLKGTPAKWALNPVDLTEVAESDEIFAGADLEPEYVDINDQNLAVISFQENNYFAVIDLITAEVVSHFTAGEVDLENVDVEEEDLIKLEGTLTKRREPDAVAWIDADSFASANEGDYEDADGQEGGSRSFTVFNIDGSVEYESYESFEHWITSLGQYNEGRSENKGVEPESVETGTYKGGDTFLFVGSERSNMVGVYDVADPSNPEPLQLLPTGIGPEGLKAIPNRSLFVASTESSEEGAGIPTMINIYEQGGSSYPTIQSDVVGGLPIPWVALSGLVGHPSNPDLLYGVSDSFLAEGFIYTIDVSQEPALIIDRLQVTGASAGLDLEGIAIGPGDGDTNPFFFWLGSEGNTGSRPNLVLKVDQAGDVVDEIELPADLVDDRRGNGIEGIAVTGDVEGEETVYVAIQRAWPGEGDTDKVNTKIGRYVVDEDTWTFVHYPLEAEGNGDWIGLSELTLLPDGAFAVIERDKGWGMTTAPNAELKKVYTIDLENAPFAPYANGALDGGLSTLSGKTELYDVLPILEAMSIFTAEKLEGFAVTADHQVYTVTDNDGVDDATGETVFIRLGELEQED